MTSLIRPEATTDCAAIEALIECAFLHAEHSSHTEHLIVNALRRAGQLSVSLAAEADERVVGHVAVSPVQVSDGSAAWFGLGPIAVLPAFRQHGVGSALMHAALAALQRQGAAGCVLLGDPRFYARFGFRAMPPLWLADVPPAYFQALHWLGDLPEGEVRYHAAFDATT